MTDELQDLLKEVEGRGKQETVTEVEVPELTDEQFHAILQKREYPQKERFDELNGKVSEYEALVADYEAKNQISPFANEVAKEVNELIRRGVPNDQLISFIKIQNSNLDEMDDTSLIKQQAMFENPNWTASDVDLWFENKYSNIAPVRKEDGKEVEADRARYDKEKRLAELELKKNSLGAKEYMRGLVKNISENKLDESKAQEQQRRAQLTDSWGKVATSFLNDFKLNFQFQKEDTTYGFEYDPRLDEKTIKELSSIVAQQAAVWQGAGLPLTKDSLPEVERMLELVVANADFENYKKALYLDAYNKGLEASVRGNASKGNPKRGSSRGTGTQRKSYPKSSPGYI